MPSGYEKTRDQGTRKLLLRQIVRKIFLEDWALKLVALVITLGLWFGVTGLSTPSTKRFTVQLTPNVANNIEITNNAISTLVIGCLPYRIAVVPSATNHSTVIGIACERLADTCTG